MWCVHNILEVNIHYLKLPRSELALLVKVANTSKEAAARDGASTSLRSARLDRRDVAEETDLIDHRPRTYFILTRRNQLRNYIYYVRDSTFYNVKLSCIHYGPDKTIVDWTVDSGQCTVHHQCADYSDAIELFIIQILSIVMC